MTYFKLRILILLIVMPVSTWHLFKFFTNLSGVNISSAAALAFKFDSGVPVLLRVSAFLGFFMFMCINVALLLHVETPKKMSELEKYHTVGLMGYHTKDLHTMLYDPPGGSYKDYYFWGGPALPGKFTETFETVLLFKPPSQEYYEDTSQFGPGANITRLVIILFLIPITYIFLFIMATFYNEYNGINAKPDHRAIAENFREITGMHWWKAAVILFAVLLIISAINSIWVGVKDRGFRQKYIPYQQELRSMLMEKVKPGDSLRGRVILRFVESVDQSYTEETARGTRTKKSYYHIMNYTVEFRDILRIPVYLKLPLYPGSEESTLLEKPFTAKYGSAPEYIKEYSFIVNDDYSVSMKTGE